jgi:hypothetical protein
MPTLTEGRHAGGFLVWEVLRDYTRETVTIASGAGKLEPGTVLGKITTGGKFVVLRGPAIVNRHEIAFLTGATEPQIAAATAALAALGIVLR